MPRLIFVNRFFFPDHSATSQILSDLAFHLAAAGREVHVITSRQSYDDPKASFSDEEIISGVQVHRVASTQFGRGVLAGRALDYLSFYYSIGRRLKAIAGQGDIIIAKTDPPLTSVATLIAIQPSGARLVNWLQDIYPETAVNLDVPLLRGPVGAALTALRNRSLQKAEVNVAVGKLMGSKVASFGAASGRIEVIPNWCDDEKIRPIPAAENPLRQEWGLTDKFVFGYSGNLGRAHEYETILAAAESLRDEPNIVFLMIGGGKRFGELHSIVEQRRLRSFRFMPYQGRDTLPFSLGVADAHWLSLNPKLEGLVVPSKFYGIAAAGRSIVVIGDRHGELAPLVEQYGCGICLAPGESKALVEVLRRMSQNPSVVKEMGSRAREMLDVQFTRASGLKRWSELIDRLISASR